MKLTILGTATPYPRPDNPCSGYLVQHGITSIWMDAGTGTLAELQRHIPLDRLDAIWISHAHADHCRWSAPLPWPIGWSAFSVTGQRP